MAKTKSSCLKNNNKKKKEKKKVYLHNNDQDKIWSPLNNSNNPDQILIIKALPTPLGHIKSLRLSRSY
jgi:hypothetical protein